VFLCADLHLFGLLNIRLRYWRWAFFAPTKPVTLLVCFTRVPGFVVHPASQPTHSREEPTLCRLLLSILISTTSSVGDRNRKFGFHAGAHDPLVMLRSTAFIPE
jgi:hypothetical protein